VRTTMNVTKIFPSSHWDVKKFAGEITSGIGNLGYRTPVCIDV
jgi:hypothetical protein